MKKLALLFALLLSLQAYATEKHALIIAIGDYPSKTGWSAISSKSDVPLITNALLSQGFDESNISTLIDAQATKKGILDALNALKSRIKKGDIVVVHYSGHGQQIFDDNGDEVDGLDEALVPYDAFVKYTHSYKGENHLRDDEIGNIVAAFRNTLGSTGQLLWILDSCHSGSATRGGKTRGGASALVPADWEPTADNSTKSGSGLLERTMVQSDAAPFVMISGASANELNYEYNGVGSLSYAFSKSLNELGTDFTYRQLFSNIAANMNVITPKQRPTIEGDVDFKLFKGEYVAQQQYFDVTAVLRNNDVINMNAGEVNRIFKNTKVFILPAGTIEVDPAKVLAKGQVTLSKFGESIVLLDKPLKDNNPKNYWVFIDQPSYGDIAVNVYLYDNVADEQIRSGIAAFLDKNSLGEVVADSLDADVLVYKSGSTYSLSYATGADEFNKSTQSRGDDALNEISSKIFNYAQGSYLKNMSIKNQAYEFDFKLVPVEYEVARQTIGNERSAADFVKEDGIFAVRPKTDYVVLEITNKSDKELYISIVEINSAGEISPFFPNPKCNLSNSDRKLAPGQTMRFNSCVYSFSPPYERLVLKGFASDKPLNFQSTVATRGTRTGTQNPLEKFLQQSYTQTRGSGSEEVSGSLDGYSTEFVYDIVEK